MLVTDLGKEVRIPLEKIPIDAAQYQSLKALLLGMSGELSAEVGDPPAIEWMLLHHFVIIFLTLVGNSLLIYVILKNNVIRRRKRVTPVQMLMLHMCAADLLFALITMVPTMAMTATVPVFHGPDMLCKTVKFLQVIPMYASSFLLVAISADRFQAICRPLASMKSNAYKRPAFYASIAWALALLFSTPQFVLFKKSEEYCCGWLSLLSCLQSCLASTSFGSNFQANGKAGQMGFSVAGMQVHHKGATLQCVELDRRRVQTVKLTLTIVAGNFILWAPFCITSVIDALWPSAINPTVATYIMFFGNLNSFMNPWIWFYFNRAQFVRALPCYTATDPLLYGRRTMDGTTDYSNECHGLRHLKRSMPPATSFFPGCCCARNVKKSKHKQKTDENAVAIKQSKHHLVIPKVALNGKIITSGSKRRSNTAPEHTAIEIPEEFVTARTSRELNNNQHLSMKELMRTVRIEEGLHVTPRDGHQQGPSTSTRPIIVDKTAKPVVPEKPQMLELVPSNLETLYGDLMLSSTDLACMQPRRACQCCLTPLIRLQQRIAECFICDSREKRRKRMRRHAQQLAQRAEREKAKKAVFDAEGDITSRSISQSPAPDKRSLCSVATISGDMHLTLPQPAPPPQPRSNYVTYVPQMLLAVITISFAWLANLINYMYR
ncbi:unnamed protein product [Cylicocyclus nassatus]|uniref:G-protein coupled receptors family 1 profile domain-containing protein n=1 Tax=Cylicocyclus nassatus TaxID=53992 RepID=A0AA36M2W4_CYLNA|nr:unnamed protein product [Cylicocyclus nassatus]